MLARCARLIALALVIAGLAVPASAQSEPNTVTFHGTVLDSMRDPIKGSRVTAVSASGASRETVTDDRGAFALTLQPGTYTVTIAAPGFVDNVQRLTLGGTPVEQNVVLAIAGVREAVTVNGERGYQTGAISSATKTLTPLRDVPQSVTVVTQELMKDQLMTSVADVVRYVPGVTTHQGENNRDQVVIRGNSSSADFYVNGVRDDVQYYRDLYNLDRVEALKGPNALMFGRGGAGGVINRVVKEATFAPLFDGSLQLGGFDNKRATVDVGQALGQTFAFRINGMAEKSGSFRDGVDLERQGINPTVTFVRPGSTKVTLGYEYLHDTRVADRGITSYRGRPADVDPSTFYGNAADSDVRADVNLVSAMVEQPLGAVTLRNRTMVGNYDRGYQNYVPGAANADATLVTITAYNNATERTNLFNQTDLTWGAGSGRVKHTFLSGIEVGHQSTDNFRNTGFFNNTATSVLVPFDHPAVTAPVVFRQSATDADNHLNLNAAAAFVQDQVELSPHLQLVGGLRADRFDLEYHNNRTGETLTRPDTLVSPRAGVVVKPMAPVSLYGSYSVSYLPSSGDQFSSLTTITQQVKPERFNNYEVGAKWDAMSALSLTTALYRLDRTNTRSTDPNDPTRIIQTGSQRTNGYEFGANGEVTRAWKVAGGYAYQDAYVSSATTSARAGAQVGQVPHHTFSLWNNYQVLPRLSAGLGIVHRSEMFVAVDNTVTLPGYTRADAAAYFSIRRDLRLQLNVENLFDVDYFANADSNTNISPGFPRTVRLALTTRF